MLLASENKFRIGDTSEFVFTPIYLYLNRDYPTKYNVTYV